jgi:hypothetical protein
MNFPKLKVMADPVDAGRHPYHDSRWIVTEDAIVEWNDRNPHDWALEHGSLICMMRDVDPKWAKLLASAPELLAMLERVFKVMPSRMEENGELLEGHIAVLIAKAKGNQ